jgi:hypothetical protein
MLDISEAEVLDRLLVLQDRGVIVPVSIQTILQRQGMGLANGEIGMEKQNELPDEEGLEENEPELPSEESSTESVEEEVPVEEPEKADEPEADIEPEKEEESEVKEEIDPMEAFVKDVESLLAKEKEAEEDKDP